MGVEVPSLVRDQFDLAAYERLDRRSSIGHLAADGLLEVADEIAMMSDSRITPAPQQGPGQPTGRDQGWRTVGDLPYIVMASWRKMLATGSR